MLTLEFLAYTFLGPHCPLLHTGVTQLAHLLDKQRLNLIGRLQRTLRIAGDGKDDLDSLQHLRMFAQLFDQFQLRGAELLCSGFLDLHPHSK